MREGWKYGGLIVLLSIFFYRFTLDLKTTLFIPNSWMLEQQYFPTAGMDQNLIYNGSMPTKFADNQIPDISIGPLNHIIFVKLTNVTISLDESEVKEWIQTNLKWIENAVTTFGGVVFRGFPIRDVLHFDKLISSLHSDKNGTEVYLGTRNDLIEL